MQRARTVAGKDVGAASSKGRQKGKRALPQQQQQMDIQLHTPPPKRKKNKEVAEKRLARFLPQPNSSVRERIARAFTHRLYLIERTLVGPPETPSSCEFFVLGATGNVYTVKLQLMPSCTCPDFSRGHTCKHILFVMLRVLKVPPDDPRIWQKALLQPELSDLLQQSSINEGVLANQRVRQRFKQITGSAEEHEAPKAEAVSVQREIEGDCPVCYEQMAGDDGKPLEPVVFCKVCGNNVHADCFKHWSRSKGRGPVTCIYCRALWADEAKGIRSASGGAYLNLASYSDSHLLDDTSLEALYPESYRWFSRR